MSNVTTLTVLGDANANVSVTAITNGITEIYTIDSQNLPKESMLLVQSSRKQILQSINMEKMFDNLECCVDLLNITYNAVNGMDSGISKSVAGIQSDFLNVLIDSVTTMQGFESGTDSVVNDLIKAYGFLTKPIYAKLPLEKNGVVLACKIFESIKQKSERMQSESETIAKSYENLRDKTARTNGNIMNVRDKDYDLRQRKLQELNQLQAQIEGYQEVKEDLNSEISDYSTQYNQLSRKIDTQEQRAYSLALTSAILGGVSAMLGSIIPFGSKKNESGSSEPGHPSSTGSDSHETAPDKERCISSEKEVKDLQEKIAKNKKDLENIKSDLGKLSNDDKEKKEELLKKQDEIEIEKTKNETDLNAASSKLEIYQQASGGVSSGLQVTADKLDQISQKAGDSLEGMYARIDNIAAQKAKLAKERRETILKMATLTKSLEFASTEHHDLEIALNALIAAVGCMRLVEVYLADITLFWKNVKSFCTLLIEEISKINDEASNFKDIDDYTIFFFDKDFIRLYLLNMVNWIALHSISRDYLGAFNGAFTKHKSVMGKLEKSREDHWKIAQSLALDISLVFDKQLEE